MNNSLAVLKRQNIFEERPVSLSEAQTEKDKVFVNCDVILSSVTCVCVCVCV